MVESFLFSKKAPSFMEGIVYIHRGSGEYLENFTLLFISPFL